MGTPLTVERCASIRAEMEAGRMVDDVLSRAGLGAEEWTTAQRTWLEKMGEELKRGRFELTNRYTQAFVDRQRELSALDRPAPVEAPAAEAPAASPPPPVALPPPEIVAPPVFAAAPSPWVSPPPQPAAAPPAVQVEERSPWASGEETGAPSPSPLRAPLPFQPAASGAAAAPPPPPPARPAPPPSHPALGGTVAGVVMSPFATGQALPFKRDAAAPPASSRPSAPPPRPASQSSMPAVSPPSAAAPPPPSRPQPAPASDSLAGTIMGAISPFAAGAPLPFVQAKPASPPAAPTAAPSPPAAVASPPAPAASPATTALPVFTSSPPAAAASPPAGLTIEQYASLCAELAFSPAQAEATLGRYRVSAAVKAELDQYWGARFAAEPAQQAKWREAYQIYFGFLTSARRR